MKPVNSYILAKVAPEEEKTAGGLYVPQGSNSNAIDILKEGTVLEVSKKAAEETGVKVGDTVYFNKHAITKIPNNTEEVLVRYEDLYAIL